MIPPNGASMGDAANTREDEGPCICDGCLNEIHCNGSIVAKCQDALEAEIADDAVKARKERDP